VINLRSGVFCKMVKEPLLDGKFQEHLQLADLGQTDRLALDEIRTNFFRYLNRAKISESQARELSVSPLLRLAGYHQPPIYLEIEEEIDRIYIDVPSFNLIDADSATVLLEVLKAIRDWEPD
jgi:hypothetical protein